MWKLERTGAKLVRRWEWQVAFSSHGLSYGFARTKRQAARRLLRAQRQLLSDEW